MARTARTRSIFGFPARSTSGRTDPAQAATRRREGRLLAAVQSAAGRTTAALSLVAGAWRRKPDTTALLDIDESYRTLVESMDDAVSLKDRNGRYLLVNSEHARRLGRSKEDIVGKTPWDLYDRTTASRIIEQHGEVVRSGKGQEMEHYEPGLPSPLVFQVHQLPMLDSAGRTAAVLAVSRDITEVARERERLRCQAVEDELTGLYNRRGFEALAEHHLRLANRTGTRLGLVFIDVDNLKTINDTFGHLGGDAAIAAVARVLRENCRKSDVVARFGGDEFAVLLVDTSPDRTGAVVRRVRDACLVAGALDGSFPPLSISVGSVQADPGCPTSLGEMLARADRSMYEEKAGKRALQLQ